MEPEKKRMEKFIYCTYMNVEGAQDLVAALAGEIKSRYLISQLRKILPELTVITMASPEDVGQSFPQKEIRDGNVKFVVPPSDKADNKILSFINNRKRERWFRRYLHDNCDKNTVVFFYHSLGSIGILTKAQKKIGFKLVGEVEEIYSYMQLYKKKRKFEIRELRKCDAFIPITKNINSVVNLSNKPYVVYYGAYDNPPENDSFKFNDGKIHAVFAGGFFGEWNRGRIALSIAPYLPANWKLELLPPSYYEEAKEIVDDFLSTHEVACEVELHRRKTGKEYTDFLQACDIAISVQDSTRIFNAYSFPSKVTVYLSCGLWVVSTKLEVFDNCGLASCVTQIDNNDSKEFANALIENVGHDKKEILETYEREKKAFEDSLRKLVEDVAAL